MTRPRKSDLVLDGRDVFVRLKAERQATKGLVHIDWVRFTVRTKNAPIPTIDELFPPAGLAHIDCRREQLAQLLQSISGRNNSPLRNPHEDEQQGRSARHQGQQR